MHMSPLAWRLCVCPIRYIQLARQRGFSRPSRLAKGLGEKLHVLKNNVYGESDDNATGLQKAGRVMVF
jgi:hypothetical protein